MPEPKPGNSDTACDGRAVSPPQWRDGVTMASKGEIPGAAAAACMTVLYDGACPLCRREIGLYRDLPAASPLHFEDISDSATVVPEGVTRARLLARFHVRQADGSLLSGAQAFLAMWAVLPGWRWLARLGRVPGVAWMMERAYRAFLRVRPPMQRWAARLDRAQTDGPAGR